MDKVELVTDREKIVEIAPELEMKVRAEEFPFIFLVNHQIVAQGELKFDSGEIGALEVKYLHVLDKKKGFGRMFVEYIKTLPDIKEIWGESIADAVPFWHKVGVKFNEREFDDYINTTEFEEDYLLPFSIVL